VALEILLGKFESDYVKKAKSFTRNNDNSRILKISQKHEYEISKKILPSYKCFATFYADSIYNIGVARKEADSHSYRISFLAQAPTIG